MIFIERSCKRSLEKNTADCKKKKKVLHKYDSSNHLDNLMKMECIVREQRDKTIYVLGLSIYC